MSNFKRTNAKVFTNIKRQTPESSYWKKFGLPVLIKEFGPVDYVDFSSSEPFYFAATSSARVQIYNPVTKDIYKNLNKFKETAYGGSFRNDGQLLCAGSEEPVVRMFNVSARSLLRRFKGHTAAVHRTFFTSDNTHIASFSDDKSVILWDVPTEQNLTQYQNHSDYIRAGCVSPISSDILLSGSYDNTVKMYDTRSSSVVCSLDHGSPVESLLFLPSGSIFISAGGKEVKVWDAFTRNILMKFTQYHKTVTCMCYSAHGKRLLTGSLDRRIKIIDTATYRVTHTISYTSPILSVGISENEGVLAVGMVNGLLSVQRRTEFEPQLIQRIIPHRYVGDSSSTDASIDLIVQPNEKDRLPKYEFALRKFQYSKAIDIVIVHQVAYKTPAVVVTVFDELIRRRGLMSAISGRDSKQLGTILRFIIRFIHVERFTRVLTEVSDCIIDAYADITDSFSTEVKNLFKTLRTVVRQEERITQDLLKLQGALEMLFSAANLSVYNSNRYNSNRQITNGSIKSL